MSSPLVKTALYGENPNWGRIVSKIGSIIPVDYRKVRLSFSDGRDTYAFSIAGKTCDLGRVARILKSKAITITVDLKSGKGKARGWGCDMSEEYVRVNAEYN